MSRLGGTMLRGAPEGSTGLYGQQQRVSVSLAAAENVKASTHSAISRTVNRLSLSTASPGDLRSPGREGFACSGTASDGHPLCCWRRRLTARRQRGNQPGLEHLQPAAAAGECGEVSDAESVKSSCSPPLG
ncbi:unnamed protein product [Pleuronectes platessa]|uniref:Uncharacterized protein n=1 Tax=Pleuronectes platessa TaxID=8262 RepID=A0A9N7YEY9_PLEPL|nr:unnamed protein product [Pleuronectes platessa]